MLDLALAALLGASVAILSVACWRHRAPPPAPAGPSCYFVAWAFAAAEGHCTIRVSHPLTEDDLPEVQQSIAADLRLRGLLPAAAKARIVIRSLSPIAPGA